MITATQWVRILQLCGVHFTTSVNWGGVFERRVQPENFSLGVREIDDFLGQVLVETGMLEHLEENLNYSAARLVEVWPGRFPTIAAAMPYAYHPEALGNKTYGGRMGNVQLGDGFRFLGRGIPMVTGRDNYALLATLTGLPLLDHPELLQVPDTALRCAILWWEKKVPDSAIDSCERVTRAVNGGVIALAERQRLTACSAQALTACGVA